MSREEKSERSQRLVLDAALRLFSRHGYGATTMRQIAAVAGISTGAVYHHFPDKETIFHALLDEFFEICDSNRFPFTRVLGGPDVFPDNIEQLGFSARDSVRQYRSYFALIHVDVVEFEGTHIQKFYGDMGERFRRFFEERGQTESVHARLRGGVSATSAILLTTRMFFNYFMLEILFGVAQPFGHDSNVAVAEIADIIRHGVVAKG